MLGVHEEDTETLLALLESSLGPDVPSSQGEMLEALVAAGGNVNQAAQSFKSASSWEVSAGSSMRPSKRRKLENSLSGWLVRTKSTPSTSSASLVSGTSNTSPSLPVKERPITCLTSPEVSSISETRSSDKHVRSNKNCKSDPPPLLSILKAPLFSPKKKISPPPLLLGTPELVTKYTPTTLHHSVLPNELASRLFYVMLDEAKYWKTSKWYINDRLVESPHLSCFYTRDPDNNMDEAAKYWYNGQVTQTPKAFPGEMEEALSRIEELVNEQISKRKRFPFEWAGSPKAWRANVAASNCYRGSKEGVGPHSDRLTYLGPYPTIASLSLGTTRTFRLREVIPAANKEKRQAQTFDIPLPHNSLLIMHPPTQEFFKHSIPTVKSIDTFRPNHPRILGEDTRKYNERINITFRFYRPDFQPTFIPRCHCEGNIPMTLKSNQKRRGEDASFFWQCQAGAQNEGKTCYYWKEMDMEAEGRGPCIKDIPT